MRRTGYAACIEEMLIWDGACGRRHQGRWEHDIKIYLKYCVQFWGGWIGLITGSRSELLGVM